MLIVTEDGVELEVANPEAMKVLFVSIFSIYFKYRVSKVCP